MEDRVEIKEEPSWDDNADDNADDDVDDDGDDVDVQPPLEVYLKTEFCDEQESQQQPGGDVQDGANSRKPDRSSSSEDGEIDDDDISQIQPDVLIHTPDEDPLEFPTAASDPINPEPDPGPAQIDHDSEGKETPPLEEQMPDGQDLAYSCSGCPLSYSTLAYLKTHKKYCRNLKVPKRKKRPRARTAAAVESATIDAASGAPKKPQRFKCDICGQRTSTNSNFKQHMLQHSGAKPHKCPQCGTGFARKADMNRHMLGHKGEKPYACQICGLRFIQSAHLTRHLRVHTGDRPFVCEICGEAFANKSNLTPHKRYHHKEKPHECILCGKKFAESKQLVTHTSKVHEKKGMIKNELLLGISSSCT